MHDLRKKLEEKRSLENRGLRTAIITGTGKIKTSIPGTNKIRTSIPETGKIKTSIPGADQYCKESDLGKITSKQYRAAGARKKI